jgi:hypothetical protein
VHRFDDYEDNGFPCLLKLLSCSAAMQKVDGSCGALTVILDQGSYELPFRRYAVRCEAKRVFS